MAETGKEFHISILKSNQDCAAESGQLYLATLSPKTLGCFQVFKVSLSTLQEEDLSKTLKPVKKYGNNVFAPRGNSPRLTEKVIESMPANADPRVKENILNNNYFLKRVDGDDVSIFSDDLQDLLPQNVQHVQTKQSASLDESIPVYLIILLIVVGILVGVLGTCSVLVFVDYKNNPKFDTTPVRINSKIFNDIRDEWKILKQQPKPHAKLKDLRGR
ncbi:unnamed protein product [Angiostrongylus costaricensis]|uniref:---NA n=1 Tax=Angiostrongylus costaricensis TaxID=334426 RepID=A0A158PDK0_ANGCS|nr:unnamed protein product [Angiostrongylus costaricensis]